MAKMPLEKILYQKLLKRVNISLRHSICYVNNPKTASSTIKLCLQQAELGDFSYSPKDGIHRRRSSPLLTWPELRDQNIPALLARCFVFSFVRNPYDRLRSAYVNKILCPRQNGAFRERAGLAAARTPDFATFIHAITDQDPQLADPHWRPQHINLGCDHIRYDLVGRLEQFSQDWAHIARRYKMPQTPCRMGRQTMTNPHEGLDFTPAMQRRVQMFYAQDFRLFGYGLHPGPTPAERCAARG